MTMRRLPFLLLALSAVIILAACAASSGGLTGKTWQLTAITEKVPETAVLIFTAYSERSLLSRGLESGAKGYILKEAPHQTLLRAIEKVANGEGYVDPALMPAFLTGKGRDEMLTAREREILQLLADGMSNADVAKKLFISQETVKSHVRHILAKLEADTRTHAVAIALRDSIID